MKLPELILENEPTKATGFIALNASWLDQAGIPIVPLPGDNIGRVRFKLTVKTLNRRRSSGIYYVASSRDKMLDSVFIIKDTCQVDGPLANRREAVEATQKKRLQHGTTS